MNAPPVLELRGLTVRFGGLTAVHNVDLLLERGEILSVIGPNGAGKTTLFNAISGLTPPSAGEVLFSGQLLQERLSVRVLLLASVTGLATALFFLLAVNISGIWETAITGLYVYREDFNWTGSVERILHYFLSASLFNSVLPFGVGLGAGIAGHLAIWSRSRQTPDQAARKGIARTFQNIRLFKHMTALENVLVGMDSRLGSRFWHDALRLPLFWSERARSVKEARALLDFVGLEQHQAKVSTCLSYGHQRRLEIARALALRPSLLLLDEPAAGMNPAETETLMELIVKIRQRGITVLLIEHHMKVVMGVSDRIVVLDYGNLIAEGSPKEIRENPRVIEAYLGAEEGSSESGY